MTSRAKLARTAVREAMLARLMLSGPSGSGKTRTALAIAATLCPEGKRIVLIDTEVGSSKTYADDFDFDYVPWDPPYNPRDLGETVNELAQTYGVVVVDSASHFWTGEGGTLDIADSKFGGWKDATPAQDDMVTGLLRAPAHFIVCARSKQSYQISDVVVDGRKKQKIEKLGLAPIQREGIEYELNVSATIDMSHTLSIDKTRCSLLAGRVFRPGRGAAEMGEIYGDWLSSGAPLAESDVIKALVERLNKLPEALRKTAKSDFVTSISRPETLLEAQVEEAKALVKKYEDEASATAPVEAPAPADDVPAEDAEATESSTVDVSDLVELLSQAKRKALDEMWQFDFGVGEVPKDRELEVRELLESVRTGKS